MIRGRQDVRNFMAENEEKNVDSAPYNYDKKTTMRYHLTSVRMIIIKKSMNQKCWRGFGEKGTFLYC